jgi:hypothetical protein
MEMDELKTFQNGLQIGIPNSKIRKVISKLFKLTDSEVEKHRTSYLKALHAVYGEKIPVVVDKCFSYG